MGRCEIYVGDIESRIKTKERMYIDLDYGFICRESGWVFEGLQGICL